jgi:hypothetical protein
VSAQKILSRGEGLDAQPYRPHQTLHGLSHGHIVIDNKNHWFRLSHKVKSKQPSLS